MRELVDYESYELVHVDVHCLERDGDVAWQAFEGTCMIDGDEFARAIVARYLTFELGMVGLSDDHFGLFETGLLLGRFDDRVALDLLVVGNELSEIFASS